ncbi:MAG: hypothetical protein J6K48_05920 [Lachnospiraceae bacterium]|nr:hypothetical protein [Lachnospiraceae bacterium]
MKKIISVSVIIVLLEVFYMYAKTQENYHAAWAEIERSMEISSDKEEMSSEKETYLQGITEEIDSDAEELEQMEQYYGTYQIKEFWSTVYYGHSRFDALTIQEADMMLERIVEIKKDKLVTYESLRRLGKRDGRASFSGNYMIEEIIIDNPAYEWETLNSDSEWYEKVPYVDFTSTLKKYSEEIAGKISIQVATPWGNQEYLVMENGIIMFSSLSGQYFFLEKLEKEPEKAVPDRNLSEADKKELLQEIYGTYIVTEFLPTKFYPALDSGGDILLPQGEADLMIGKEVVIGKDFFVTYDNFRLPNSEICGRAADEYLVEKVEISNPDYQLKAKLRDSIFGLRDDMLPEDMIQDEYIEINVFPGFAASGCDDVLPQLYLLDDGKIIMYAMGEYFLLEISI